MILGFSHPAIVVADLERMIDFYTKAFEFKPLSRQFESWDNNSAIDAAIGLNHSSVTGAMLAGHNCYLELFQFRSPCSDAVQPDAISAAGAGLRHLCFYTDDVSGDYHRLLELGANALGSPQADIPAVYLRDPEGNIIELAEFPSGIENLVNLEGISRLQEHTINV